MNRRELLKTGMGLAAMSLPGVAVALPLNLRHDAFGDIFCP